MMHVQALKAAGAEVVAFDMDKPETYDAALAGATGVYIVVRGTVSASLSVYNYSLCH